MAWLTALLQIFQDTSDFIFYIVPNFNLIDTDGDSIVGNLITNINDDIVTTDEGYLLNVTMLAYGVQLDIIGQIVGQSRTVNFQPTDPTLSPILLDSTYRKLLLAKIGINSWDGKIGSLQPLWKAIFPEGTIKVADNHDMTMTVTTTGSFDSIIVDLITNGYIVPRPQGVMLTGSLGDLPYFGWDRNDEYVAGWDSGHYV
jgi:hypothetical protein